MLWVNKVAVAQLPKVLWLKNNYGIYWSIGGEGSFCGSNGYSLFRRWSWWRIRRFASAACKKLYSAASILHNALLSAFDSVSGNAGDHQAGVELVEDGVCRSRSFVRSCLCCYADRLSAGQCSRNRNEDASINCLLKRWLISISAAAYKPPVFCIRGVLWIW